MLLGLRSEPEELLAKVGLDREVRPTYTCDKYVVEYVQQYSILAET
jgi:hypothetical protein